MRVVAEKMPSTKSVTVGVWVNVGSRDEQSGEEGLSHFLEHMFFKGTSNRSAAKISRDIDALGGEMNAFTTRETTTFYVRVVDQHLSPAIALLADLFHNSRFDSKEIEREKQVVLEEIRMVQDDPEDFLGDLHIQHQLHQHPLGKPILGDPLTIQDIRRKSLLHYVDTHYVIPRTVITVAGNFEWKSLVRVLETGFGRSSRSSSPALPVRVPASVRGGVLVRRKELEQAHVCLGLKGLPVHHKNRYALHILNTILGGGVSSRLFQEVRERRGLAYSICSYVSSYSDLGTLTIYAATRPKEASRLIDLIHKELRKIKKQGLPDHELRRAKNQMTGAVMLGLESTQARMSKLAREELHFGRHTSMKTILDEIRRVKPTQIFETAEEVINLDQLSVTALGPLTPRSIQGVLN